MSSTVDGQKHLAQKQDTMPAARLESGSRSRMVRLPGEVLQVQMQN
jgi:hypothetical protein